MTTTMNSIDAKENFTEILNRVLHAKERVILLRRGKQVAALVSIDDLNTLETSEDKLDLREASEALKETKAQGAIGIEQLKDEIGL